MASSDHTFGLLPGLFGDGTVGDGTTLRTAGAGGNCGSSGPIVDFLDDNRTRDSVACFHLP